MKGAAGISAGAGNRVCGTYGVAFGNKALSGGPLINGNCDPDSFNVKGLAAVAIGYNVTADNDHSFALGKFASTNGFAGAFVWGDGSATSSTNRSKQLQTTNSQLERLAGSVSARTLRARRVATCRPVPESSTAPRAALRKRTSRSSVAGTCCHGCEAST